MLDKSILGNINCLQNFDRTVQCHTEGHALRLGAGSRRDEQTDMRNYNRRLFVSHCARDMQAAFWYRSPCYRDHFVPFLTPALSGGPWRPWGEIRQTERSACWLSVMYGGLSGRRCVRCVAVWEQRDGAMKMADGGKTRQSWGT